MYPWRGFQVGDKVTVRRRLSQDDFLAFARLSGDENPIHTDALFSARTRFGRPVAHGMFLYGLILSVLGTYLPGPGTAVLEQELIFPTPTYAGEEVAVEVEITALQPDEGIAEVQTMICRPDGNIGCQGQAKVYSVGAMGWPHHPATAPLSWPPSEAEALKGLHLGEHQSITRTFTMDDVRVYSTLTGDCNPLYVDSALSERWGWPSLLLPAGLLGALFSCLLGEHLPGAGTNYLKQKFLFLKPAYQGEGMNASVEVIRLRPEKELVNLRTTCRNQAGEMVCDGVALVLVRDLIGRESLCPG